MADGKVLIDVGMNTSKAEKDLAKLKDKIQEAEKNLNRQNESKSALEERLNAATEAAGKTQMRINEITEAIQDMEAALHGENGAIEYDPETFQGLSGEIQLAKKELAEQEKILKAQTKEVTAVQKEYQSLNTKVETGTEKLHEMKEQAGLMAQEIARAKPGEMLAQSLDNAKKKMMTFLKYAIGIRSLFFLFRRLRVAVTEAFQAFAETDAETKTNIQNLKNATESLKVAFGQSFAAIYNAVAPVLLAIIGWLIDAANAVARFIAVLSGRNSFKRIVANTAKVSQGLDNVAESAQEAQRQLMGFDELEVLNAPGGSGSSGKGSGSGSPGYSMIEEAIDPFDGSFLNNLALSVKDVLFDWSDLNPEQIAEKIIAGLGAVLGMVLGISLGLGAGGVLTMTITGLVLGLVADAIIFDHDGQISPEETKSMIRMAIMGLIGGVAGLAIGAGLPGAIIGFTVGASLSLALTALEKRVTTEGITVGEFGEIIKLALAGLIGGIVGMMLIPGFGGAFIGASLAIGLALLFSKEQTKSDEFGPGVKNALIDSITSTDFAELHNVLMYKIDRDVFGENWANFWWSHGDYAGKDIIMGLINGTDSAMPQAAENMDTKGRETGDAYDKGLSAWAEASKESLPAKAFGWIAGKVKEVLGLEDSSTEGMNAVGKLAGEGFELGLNTWLSATGIDTVVGVFRTIATAVRTFLQIGSPSRLFESMGIDTMEGFKIGIQDRWKSIETFLTTSLETIKTKFSETWENLKQKTQTTWENIKTNTQNVWENIKSNLSSKWENLKSSVASVWENIKQKITGTNHQIENETATQASKIREQTTKEYETMRNSVQNTIRQMQTNMNQTWNTIKTSTVQHVTQMTQQVQQMFQSMYNQIRSNVEQIKGLLNFEWSIPRPKIPVISWYYNYVQSGDGSTFAIPQFFVNWYAKGGVFDAATLIGIGENGKEAVVPLEKNTEWINLVADGLLDSLKKSNFASQIAESMASMPMPAMAGGGIAPPNAFSGQFGGGWANTLMEEIKGLKEEISALSRRPIEVDTKMYIDRREIGRAAATYQRETERTWG